LRILLLIFPLNIVILTLPNLSRVFLIHTTFFQLTTYLIIHKNPPTSASANVGGTLCFCFWLTNVFETQPEHRCPLLGGFGPIPNASLFNLSAPAKRSSEDPTVQAAPLACHQHQYIIISNRFVNPRIIFLFKWPIFQKF